jgi:allantoinase
VVLEDGIVERDVVVRDGRIAAIVEPGQGSAAEEIRAAGLAVMPGAVDAHVHLNEPGREEWEGWAAGTRGAALAGTTTVCDMPLNSIPPTLDRAPFDLKRDAAARSAHVDHALWGGLVDANVARLRRVARRGAVGVKAFLVPSGVPEFPHVTDGALEPALAAAVAAGLLVAVHAEPEARAIARVAQAAARTGARVHVVHVGSAAGVREIRRARARGIAITGETCPHYLTFTSADVRRAGPVLKCAPPIGRASDRDALWRALASGDLELAASDHSPCPARMKETDFDDAWGGVAGIQSLLPVLLTEGRRRGLSLSRIAWLVATAPARLLGIARRKGAIRVGADADLILVDPDRRWTLSRDDVQARSAVSPYVGHRFHGAVERTIVRGRTVQSRGEIVSGAGWGELVLP